MHGERAVRIQHERCAVEHQFILPADEIEIDQRQLGSRHPCHSNVHPEIRLGPIERRTVGRDQDLRAAFRKALANLLLPNVFADRHTDLDALEHDGPRQRTGRENAQLVEHAVVGQLDLRPHRLHLTLVEQHDRIVDARLRLALFRPDRAREDRRPRPHGAGQMFDRMQRRLLERRAQHEILRRIAGHEQFRKNHKVSTQSCSLRTGGTNPLDVAGNVTDNGVELCKGNLQTGGRCGHAALLGCLGPRVHGAKEAILHRRGPAIHCPATSIRPHCHLECEQ